MDPEVITLGKTLSRHRKKSSMCFLSYVEKKTCLEYRRQTFFFFKGWLKDLGKRKEERRTRESRWVNTGHSIAQLTQLNSYKKVKTILCVFRLRGRKNNNEMRQHVDNWLRHTKTHSYLVCSYNSQFKIIGR